MVDEMITRRGLIAGLGTLLAAPAIVRVSSLMPVKAWAEPPAAGRWRILGEHPALLARYLSLAGPDTDKVTVIEIWDATHPQVPFVVYGEMDLRKANTIVQRRQLTGLEYIKATPEMRLFDRRERYTPV